VPDLRGPRVLRMRRAFVPLALHHQLTSSPQYKNRAA